MCVCVCVLLLFLLLLLLFEKLFIRDQELRLDVVGSHVKPDLHLTRRGNQTSQMEFSPDCAVDFLLVELLKQNHPYLEKGSGILLMCSDVVSY